MKYIMLFILLFTVGCNKKIEIDNVQNISYKEISLPSDDYNIILDNINGKYEKTNNIHEENISIEIVDNYNIHTFYITNNKIFTIKDNKTYYKNNNDLLTILDTLYLKYTNTDFFHITYSENYIHNEETLNIKLDNTLNNYNLVIKEDIKNFKIYDENNELLYSIDDIITKDINIRTDKKIKIIFENKYNFIIEITKEEDFIIKIKQK